MKQSVPKQPKGQRALYYEIDGKEKSQQDPPNAGDED